MLHIIQNDPEVPPGKLLEHLTVPYRISITRTVASMLPELTDIRALIVLGGAMGANDDRQAPVPDGPERADP